MAAGSGSRMGAGMPKQFLELGGKAVLQRTIEVFMEAEPGLTVVTVLPEQFIQYWKDYCYSRNFTCPQILVKGGMTRFHSVRNALERIPTGAVVGVHDGVRPFVSQEVIARCYSEAESKNAVIPVIGVVETVRRLNGEDSVTVPRDQYKLVQTPQVFDVALLRKAYNQEFTDMFTDDASVVEALGERVHLVEGNRENIKLTTPFDLKLAEMLIE